MGIPQVEMMELTGEVRIKLREKAWQQKRILFLTPHVIDCLKHERTNCMLMSLNVADCSK